MEKWEDAILLVIKFKCRVLYLAFFFWFALGDIRFQLQKKVKKVFWITACFKLHRLSKKGIWGPRTQNPLYLRMIPTWYSAWQFLWVARDWQVYSCPLWLPHKNRIRCDAEIPCYPNQQSLVCNEMPNFSSNPETEQQWWSKRYWQSTEEVERQVCVVWWWMERKLDG